MNMTTFLSMLFPAIVITSVKSLTYDLLHTVHLLNNQGARTLSETRRQSFHSTYMN